MMKISELNHRILFVVCGLFFLSACASTGHVNVRAGGGVQNISITPAVVRFDFNKALIREADRAVLDGIADMLKANGKAVAVLVGHADEVGQPLYNEILGENRARAVRVYLRDRGVDPGRLTFTSKGAKEPVVVGSSPESRARNRRVEIFIALIE